MGAMIQRLTAHPREIGHHRTGGVGRQHSTYRWGNRPGCRNQYHIHEEKVMRLAFDKEHKVNP